MKKLSRTLLSLLLCLTVAMSMCLTFTEKVSAATVNNGGTISVTDINSAKALNPNCEGEYLSRNTSKTLTYNLKLPSSAGTIFVMTDDDLILGTYVNGKSGSTRMTSNGYTLTSFYSASNTAKLELSKWYAEAGYADFGVWFAPANRTVATNGTEYILGATGDTAGSNFTVTAPGKGYLEIVAYGGMNSPYSTQLHAPGFSGWQSLYSSNGYKTYVGVNKGAKYTINLKSNYTAVRNVKVTFRAVKETSSKTSKKKAAKIKKKKANKGIVVSNAKKVHWYKIKNKKNSKMKLVFDASKISSGGSSSGKLKVTMVFPDGKKQSGTVYAGYKTTFTVKYGTIGTKKARKGTYYVKVQSQNGATGYYTMTWK